MSRYIVRADHTFGDDTVFVPSLSVEGSGPVKTGLLDSDGRDIWRASEPIGFVTEFKPRIRVRAIMERSNVRGRTRGADA